MRQRRQAGKQEYASLGIHSKKESRDFVESIMPSKLWKTPENSHWEDFTLWEGFPVFYREKRDRQERGNRW